MSNDDYQHRSSFCKIMSKEIIKFPQIEGIKWVSKVVPDIIEVPIELYRRDQIDLGLEQSDTVSSIMYLDLSKVTIVRPYFPKDKEGDSPTECVVEAAGAETTVITVSLNSMMKAWIFYKKYYKKSNDTGDIRHSE